jgi:head-tail adaptor
MKVPGPKTLFALQEPGDGTRTDTGGTANTWATVTTFNGSLGPVTAFEASRFERETVVSTHRVIVGYEEIGDAYVADLKAKNRLYVANAGNELAAETFDITGVEPFRFPGNKIATFELTLRKVE